MTAAAHRLLRVKVVAVYWVRIGPLVLLGL